MSPPEELRWEAAAARIDEANTADPHRVQYDGQDWPEQLLYGQRMSHWLAQLSPDASESLRLAARAQHLRRWLIPRDTFPRDRQGYHRWRRRLYDFHAEETRRLLTEVGYDEATITRVAELVRKEHLASDPEAQLLEDAACLVFLEQYLAPFAREHDEPTMLRILRRTWHKMSPAGQTAARQLPLTAPARQLLAKALAE